MVSEANQMMQVLTTVTDAGGNLASVPFPVNGAGKITLTRRAYIHCANNYFMCNLFIKMGTLPYFTVQYCNMDYADGTTYMARHGIFIARNDVSSMYLATQNDVSSMINPIWDTWFNESITYDPLTGVMEYLTNNVRALTYNVGILPQTDSPTMKVACNAWGWWTGHQQLFEDLVVTQAPAPPPQLTALGVSNGVFCFTLYGSVGSNYVLQVSTNLVNWRSYATNTIPQTGSLIVTDPTGGTQPHRYYRVMPIGLAGSYSFLETFTNAPTYTNNWKIAFATGTTQVSCTPGNLRVQANASWPESYAAFLSNNEFTGDLDYSVELNHQGRGRTVIGLWDISTNNWVAQAILDTDDTDQLNFAVGAVSTEYKYAGTPYMNRWITLRIRTVGDLIRFYADGTLLETMALPKTSGPLQLRFQVGSVSWKSGAKDTSFRRISAIGTRP